VGALLLRKFFLSFFLSMCSREKAPHLYFNKVGMGISCLSASNGNVRRYGLRLALSLYCLFAAVAPGHALTPDPVEAARISELIALCKASCGKIPAWVWKESKENPKLVLLALFLTGLLSGAAISVSGRGNKNSTLAVPKAVRSFKTGVKEPQDADLMVIAPSGSRPRETIIVQVIVHTPDREAEAQSNAAIVGGQVLAKAPLTIRLKMKDAIHITLDCDSAKIANPVQSAFWNGRFVNLQFIMQLPATESELVLISKLRVFVNSVPAGNVIFRITVSPSVSSLVSSAIHQEGHLYRKYFLSYAKEDRAEVLKVAQTLKFLNVDYFQDILNLDPGERWKRRLFQEIEHRDVFVLFWSHHAKASKFVIKEAEHALRCSKRDPTNPRPEISPYPLVPPYSVEPPASLREIQFNDPIRYAILVEEKRAKKKPRRKRLRRSASARI
jgi:hypothetical protein